MKAVVIEESTAKEYLDYGTVVIIILAVFNVLYLIEFIYTKIILSIFEFLQKKAAKPLSHPSSNVYYYPKKK